MNLASVDIKAFDASGFAANCQMHLRVDVVDAWFDHVQASGVLWRIAQNIPRRD